MKRLAKHTLTKKLTRNWYSENDDDKNTKLFQDFILAKGKYLYFPYIHSVATGLVKILYKT